VVAVSLKKGGCGVGLQVQFGLTSIVTPRADARMANPRMRASVEALDFEG
jgi:hypothetical protein